MDEQKVFEKIPLPLGDSQNAAGASARHPISMVSTELMVLVVCHNANVIKLDWQPTGVLYSYIDGIAHVFVEIPNKKSQQNG